MKYIYISLFHSRIFGFVIPRYTVYFAGAHFGEGIGPIFANELICRGSESHVRECQYKTNTFCSHRNDIGIICTGTQWLTKTVSIRSVLGSLASVGVSTGFHRNIDKLKTWTKQEN